jgi:hydroxyquinol 1,2-dioxygenase
VFGVKKNLLAEFRKIDDPAAAAKVELPVPFYDVEFDFVLSRQKALSHMSA